MNDESSLTAVGLPCTLKGGGAELDAAQLTKILEYINSSSYSGQQIGTWLNVLLFSDSNNKRLRACVTERGAAALFDTRDGYTHIISDGVDDLKSVLSSGVPLSFLSNRASDVLNFFVSILQ